MEKVIFTEELRALFREIFKIEVKQISKDVSFLGKMNGTKLNEQRMSLFERNWLQNLGVLTKDQKNFVDVDDRTIFSHVISAIYAGLYGLNFVDVTSHCLETIKQRKGLQNNQNLVDYMSPNEIRQFSIALYNFSNELHQYKKEGKLSSATMQNFYFIANRAFAAGANARRNAIVAERSEFVDREFVAKKSASNAIKNIEEGIRLGTFSHKNFECKNLDRREILNMMCEYLKTELRLRKTLQSKGFNQIQINAILGSIDEGYYKSKYFRQHNLSISKLMNLGDFLPSKTDMMAQNNKILYSLIMLKKLDSASLFDTMNAAYLAGNRAREDCMNLNLTAPEYFTSFAAALTLDKEKQITK